MLVECFAVHYEGLEQQVTFARTAGFSVADIDGQKLRIDFVERDAQALGFKRIDDRNGKRIGIAELMPSATELIKIALDEEKMYRTLSAVAQGHIGRFGNCASEPDDEEIGTTKTKAFKKQVSVDKTAWVAACRRPCIHTYLWNQCRYFGWIVR